MIDNAYYLVYTKTGSSDTTKLHQLGIKKIICTIQYCHYREDQADIDCDSPLTWDPIRYLNDGESVYQYGSKKVNATSISSTTATGIATSASQQQKDDDAALISWNRKPRDVSKHPILKNDEDYKDWSLIMKRQLISDTLYRVTDSKFATTNCRAGSDFEVSKLQLNFFRTNNDTHHSKETLFPETIDSLENVKGTEWFLRKVLSYSTEAN